MVRLRSVVWSIVLAGSFGYAYPRPVEGSEPIPKLMSDSSLVCKGEVSFAPALKFVPRPPRFGGTATVRVDRCFKGALPSSDISVLFDDILPAGGGPAVVLRTGDYRLFFLKEQDGKYEPTEEFFSTLTISRLTPVASTSITDPMRLLELDLKAGLTDSDLDRVLDNIRMLGNMRHLQSTAELEMLESSPDPMVRAYVYEAMLRLGDYSVLPAVGTFFASQPEAPQELFMPRDRLLLMQYRLASQITTIKDASELPQLEEFLLSDKLILRQNALDAVRAINSPHSSPFFYKLLNDSDVDIRFSAMQGLLTLAGGGVVPWVPTWEEFRREPDRYVAKCREWWSDLRLHPNLPYCLLLCARISRS
jgi:hypothetical protein